MRHLGDVLLSTPLIHSLNQAYPGVKIDLLVYKNTAAILAGNTDIHEIISVSKKPGRTEYLTLIRKIFRKYDLTVVTQTGDRPLIYSIFASATRIAQVPGRHCKGRWKRFLVSGWAEFDDINTHTVIQHLQLMDVLQKPKTYALSPPEPLSPSTPPPFTNYAVLHPYPLWRYKRWTFEGWKQIIDFLLNHNINVVLSGSPAIEEIEYINRLQQCLPTNVLNLAGKTSLAQLCFLIHHAKLYIGPDTGTTHLASATGKPTIALFGPTNPVKWAPWPYGYSSDINPFKRRGNQRVNNVHLVQGKGDCVPCHLEGCEKHRNSYSLCLDKLPASEVEGILEKIIEK